MKLFLDANVLVSVLNKEYPSFIYTSRILSLTERNSFELFTSPLCLAIAFYFAGKKSGRKKAKEKIAALSEHLSLTVVDATEVEKSLADRNVSDFEDGLQYYSAVGSKCKCIISEDTADFNFSSLEVLTAQEFAEKYLLR